MQIGLLVLMLAVPSWAPAEELPWREPGQVKDEWYLHKGTLRYAAEDREIVGHNRSCFNNRPLYCRPESEGVVLVGDRPLVRLVCQTTTAGAWAGGIVRDGRGKWFHNCADIESRYRCGRMTWRVADPSLPGVEVGLEAVPLADAAGFALRLKAKGLRAGDRLVWAVGGARAEGRSVRDRWDPIMRGNPDICKTGDPRKPELQLGMVPAWSAGNRVQFEDRQFRLLASDLAPLATVGRCDRPGKLLAADASACADPAKLVETRADKLPMASGVVELRPGEDEACWAVQVVPAKEPSATPAIVAPARAMEGAEAYLRTIERVKVQTPDPYLDAAVAAVCHPIDAACDRNPTVFRHGCMAFHIHFLGWRVICGSTALGWHDRVKGNAAYYLAHQVKEDKSRVEPRSDAHTLLTAEEKRSRYYGRGRIANSPAPYDTQSQFFDQTIRDWRWTADPELERALRPALELHLEWAKDCFDPDDDGLYESYINALPTDSVWYNGGGSVEESSYVCYAHLAARDMARRAGDQGAAARHEARALKIQRALRDVLWLKDRGHFGLYVEQGGRRRVHPDAWTYSQFLPIDAGLTTPEEAIQALYYTEWALQRVRLPFGGVLCQPSNWVPSKWSVRDVFNGDVWHLALAHFQSGLADEGWELLRGAMLETCYAGAVPGGFSHIGAGTDFSDCKDMFARAVVEGLFGYEPDYPNGRVRVRPAMPSSWPAASIRTPDYTLDYRQAGDADTYRLTLSRQAAVEFRLPVRAHKVLRVALDGQSIPWKVEGGFGSTSLAAQTERPVKTAEVTIQLAGRVPPSDARALEGQVGQPVRLAAPQGQIVRWMDLHEAIEGARAEGGAVVARLARRPGHHLVLADTTVGDLPQRQVFKLHVTDPQAAALQAAKTPRDAPRDARWECLDLRGQYNGDVRTIFKQQYLSPRPKTCSVRVGSDGWSAWTFPYWGNRPPEIDLARVPKLAQAPDRLLTPQCVPFARFSLDKNIAFTSLWDNWPRSVTVAVNREAEAAWLLICGSTFPMHLRIANAEIRFRYADGQTETLQLVPPWNFWSLCSWGGLDYSYQTDAFCLPKSPPPTVQLGSNCRAMVLSWRLRPGVKLQEVTLETLSQEVVIGLMGVSLMNAR